MQTTFHIVEGGFIRRDQARFGTHFDSHIAQGHTTFHAQCLNRLATEFDYVPGTAGAAGFADNRQYNIFSSNTCRRFAFHFNFHGLCATLFQGLRRQHVLHFGGPDTERQSTKRAVSGGVGVAADDGHARQGDTLFRPHHVHDTLIRVVQVIQFNAELFAVLDQFLHLDTRHFTGGIDVFGLRGNVMIHGRKGLARLTHRAIMRAQAVKRLW